MAEVNFTSQAIDVDKLESINEENNNNSEISDSKALKNSLSSEELKDPNKIKVTIVDSTTPLIVLFGPPSCGKTMTLIRLVRFLRGQTGFTIEPVDTFRPSYDENYKEMCDDFDNMINSEDAARSTSQINFMLVRVLYQGKVICQMLEGPGEHYFEPKDPTKKFPKYVNAIISSKNRKIWAIMLEPNKTNKRMDVQDRKNYVDKITQLKKEIKPKDKVFFIFNKIDETPFIVSPGKVKIPEVMKETNDLYPNIFAPFKNINPIIKIWKPYNFDFVPFQTGYFSSASDGVLTFQEGDDIYPMKLWNVLQKLIRG